MITAIYSYQDFHSSSYVHRYACFQYHILNDTQIINIKMSFKCKIVTFAAFSASHYLFCTFLVVCVCRYKWCLHSVLFFKCLKTDILLLSVRTCVFIPSHIVSPHAQQQQAFSHLCSLVSLVSHADESLQLSVRSSPDGRFTGSLHGGPRIRGAPLARLAAPGAPSRRLRPEKAFPFCVTVAGLAG